MDKAKERIIKRKRRAFRVNKKIFGRPERPRLTVRRSLRHILAQIINDETGDTIVQIGSTSKAVMEGKNNIKNASKTDISRIVGELVAEKAIAKGISKVIFDRKGYPYHGRVKALAEAARSKGLAF